MRRSIIVFGILSSAICNVGCQRSTETQPPAPNSASVEQPASDNVSTDGKSSSATGETTARWDAKTGNGVVAMRVNAAPYPGTDGPQLFFDVWKEPSTELALKAVAISSKTMTGRPYEMVYDLREPKALGDDIAVTFVLAEIRKSALAWGPNSAFSIKLTLSDRTKTHDFNMTVPSNVVFPTSFLDRELKATVLPER